MSITQFNYLDLGNLLINELIGGAWLAFIIGLIILTYVGVRFKFPLEVTTGLAILLIGAIVSYVYQAFLWMLGLFLVAIIVYAFLPKLIRR